MGVQTQTTSARSATSRRVGRQLGTVSADDVEEALRLALPRIVDRDDGGVDHAPVDHRLESEPVGPRNEARTHEADAHHGPGD